MFSSFFGRHKDKKEEGGDSHLEDDVFDDDVGASSPDLPPGFDDPFDDLLPQSAKIYLEPEPYGIKNKEDIIEGLIFRLKTLQSMRDKNPQSASKDSPWQWVLRTLEDISDYIDTDKLDWLHLDEAWERRLAFAHVEKDHLRQELQKGRLENANLKETVNDLKIENSNLAQKDWHSRREAEKQQNKIDRYTQMCIAHIDALDLYNRPIETLNLPSGSLRRLKKHITLLRELALMTQDQMLGLDGVGYTTLNDCVSALKSQKLIALCLVQGHTNFEFKQVI